MMGVRLLAMIGLLLLGACDQRALIDKMAAGEELALAKRFVELLQQRDYTAVEAQFEPEALPLGGAAVIPPMADLVPAGPPVSIVVEGVNRLRRIDFTQFEFSLQYEFPEGKWLLVEIVLVRKSTTAPLIRAVRITPLPASLREINAFALEGKPFSAYLVAGATLAVITLTVVSLIVCLFSANPRWWWKIAWCLAMFGGVGKVLVEWTSGAVSYQFVFFSWFGTWIGRLGPDGPYFFQTAFPIGVVAYWIWRQNRRVRRATAAADQAAQFD
jgi:hypothetical protein